MKKAVGAPIICITTCVCLCGCVSQTHLVRHKDYKCEFTKDAIVVLLGPSLETEFLGHTLSVGETTLADVLRARSTVHRSHHWDGEAMYISEIDGLSTQPFFTYDWVGSCYVGLRPGKHKFVLCPYRQGFKAEKPLEVETYLQGGEIYWPVALVVNMLPRFQGTANGRCAPVLIQQPRVEEIHTTKTGKGGWDVMKDGKRSKDWWTAACDLDDYAQDVAERFATALSVIDTGIESPSYDHQWIEMNLKFDYPRGGPMATVFGQSWATDYQTQKRALMREQASLSSNRPQQDNDNGRLRSATIIELGVLSAEQRTKVETTMKVDLSGVGLDEAVTLQTSDGTTFRVQKGSQGSLGDGAN